MGPLAANGNPTAAETAKPPRDMWSRGNERFVRQWLLLGPISSGSAQLDSNVIPAPGATQPLAGGLTSNWIPNSAYHDTLDLLEVFDRSVSRGHRADPEIVFAYATVARDQDGDAILSVATDNAVQVWLNGKLVHEQRTDRAFEFDGDQIPVRLNKGLNRVLLRIVRVTGPSRLALRVLETGWSGARLTEIAPSIAMGTANELTVRTHARKEEGPPVQIEVLSAGGKTVARSQAGRGDLVRFDASTWRDGAYEIRSTTQTPSGKTAVSYLPWYKGDAIAAARKLLDQAATAPNDAAGMTTRMLAEMVRARLGNKLTGVPDDAWLSIHSPLLEYEELLQGRAGDPGPVHPGGFVRLAYEDETDGSAQFCRTYLPPDYDAKRSWPVIIFLHGYNPPNPPYIKWWSVDERHSPIAEDHHVIYIEPHGRGNAQYLGIGELNVLRCLEEAERQFKVDGDRVYLTGESMGGSGTWIISSRHPDIFAAAAPVFGGWDLRVARLGDTLIEPRPDNTPPELFTQEVQSSFVNAEGLLNVPVFVSHGDSDQTVNVEFSRHAVHMLQRWGYDIRYAEHRGRGHESLNNADTIADWLLSHRRAATPHHVRLRSPDLAGASAYWARVEAREDPFQMIDVDAEIVKPGLIRLDTHNVAEITLSPSTAMLFPSPDPIGTTHPVQVVWNGALRELNLSSGSAKLTLPGISAGALAKRPGLEGGLSRLITTPFALVVGTSSADPLMRQRCQAKADAFVELWKQWQYVPPRIFRDDQITQEDQRRYSLLLIGGPADNLIARQLAARLPLKVARDGFTVDGRKYAARDAVIQLIYPSPLAPNRYVEIVAATSAEGLYFWNPPLWHTAGGFPTVYWDWTITDGRRFKLASSGHGSQRGRIASGMFDQHWRRDDRWVYLGDAELRSNSPLRHAPKPGFTVPEQLLDSYVGFYELGPGRASQVLREGASLLVKPPGGPVLRLDPESNTEFVVHDTTDTVFFVSNAQGKVSGAFLNAGGVESGAKRIDGSH